MANHFAPSGDSTSRLSNSNFLPWNLERTCAFSSDSSRIPFRDRSPRKLTNSRATSKGRLLIPSSSRVFVLLAMPFAASTVISIILSLLTPSSAIHFPSAVELTEQSPLSSYITSQLRPGRLKRVAHASWAFSERLMTPDKSTLDECCAKSNAAWSERNFKPLRLSSPWWFFNSLATSVPRFSNPSRISFPLKLERNAATCCVRTVKPFNSRDFADLESNCATTGERVFNPFKLRPPRFWLRASARGSASDSIAGKSSLPFPLLRIFATSKGRSLTELKILDSG